MCLQIPTLISAKLDCVVDLDTGKTAKMNTPKTKAAFEECYEDKRLSQYIASAIQLDEFKDDSVWLGSNGFVSSAFESYLITLANSILSVMKDWKCHPSDNTTTTSITSAASNNNSSGNSVYKPDSSSFSSLKGMVNKVIDFSLRKALPQRQPTINQDEEKTTTYCYGWQETLEKKVSVTLSHQFGQKWIMAWMKTECFSTWCSTHALGSDNNNTNVNSTSLFQANEGPNRNSSTITTIFNSSNARIITYPNGDIYEVSDKFVLIKQTGVSGYLMLLLLLL